MCSSIIVNKKLIYSIFHIKLFTYCIFCRNKKILNLPILDFSNTLRLRVIRTTKILLRLILHKYFSRIEFLNAFPLSDSSILGNPNTVNISLIAADTTSFVLFLMIFEYANLLNSQHSYISTFSLNANSPTIVLDKPGIFI